MWCGDRLALSIGTPRTVKALETDPTLTVHLDSGTDVVVVEGRAQTQSHDPELLARYERKYDREYEPTEYGPLTVVVPHVVLAWRTAGWAGREGFQAVGRWKFDA